MLRIVLAAVLLGGCASVDPTYALTNFVAGHLEAKWISMSDAQKVDYCKRCPGCCSGPQRQKELATITNCK